MCALDPRCVRGTAFALCVRLFVPYICGLQLCCSLQEEHLQLNRSPPKPIVMVLWLFIMLLPASYDAFPSQASSSANTFDVIEESPLDTVVHGVPEYLTRIVLESAEMPNSTVFQLMGMDPLTKSFVINPKTGELRIASRIDREMLCRFDASMTQQQQMDSLSGVTCVKTININIKSKSAGGGASETSQKQPIILRIVDINDNSPLWFGKSSLTVRFVEVVQSSRFGKQEFYSKSQLLDRATDPDKGPNGTVSYAIKGPGADVFRLENGEAASGGYIPHETPEFPPGPLKLRPVVPLDREVTAFYNLTLFAFDAGQPQRTNSIPLYVYITDVNDHAPVFHSYNSDHSTIYHMGDQKHGDLVKYCPARGSLMESAPIDSLVLQLNATDRDDGENGRVTYSVLPSDALFASHFSLDPVSGQLKVKRKLDFDSGPRRFTFKVIAMDGAPEPYRLTGTAVVDIELTDVNDELPEIEVLIAQHGLVTPSMVQRQSQSTGKQQELVAYIEESPSPDIVIAYVQVSDKDENGEDQIHCHLGPRDNFTLQADAAVHKSNYVFGNDVASPVANKASFREYRILAKVPTTSSIAPYSHISGGVELQNFLDREATPSQLLTITCIDRVGNQAERSIRVHLLDINDNPPVFANESYFNFVVAENREPVSGQQVWLGRVHAVDADLGDNAKLTYKLSPDQHHDALSSISMEQLFRVKPDSGDVYAQVSFDRENAPKNGIYSMTIIATDQGKPKQLTGTARLEVTVLDVNDWAPEFTQDIYTFNVPEDIDLQEIVGTVEAIDRDETASPNPITYHLSALRSGVPPGIVKRSVADKTNKRIKRDSGNQPLFVPHLEPSKSRDHRPLSFFSIDSRTGDIRVIRKLDRETTGHFYFEVLAVDSPLTGASPKTQPHGGVAEVFTATATVLVSVTDVNDNAPDFRYPNASIRLHMAPGETLGHKIYTVQATDSDDGENARVSYSIRSEIPIPPDGPGTGNFAIDEASGLIFLTRSIQGPVNHHLVIEACDHGIVPKCTSSQGIQIAVSEDAKLILGGGQQRERISGAPGSSAGDNLENGHSDRFNYNAFYSNFGGAGGGGGGFDNLPVAPHRVEVIAACLVVVFGVLLFAVVVIACLLKKKPRGQIRSGGQDEGYSYTLWGCKWPFFKQHKTTGKQHHQESASQSGPHYITTRGTEAIVDPRFADGRSLELPKGLIPGDSITNTLEVHLDEEKKPFYYDEIGMLTSEGLMSAAHLDSQTAHLLPMSPTGGLPISRSSVRASQMLYGAPPHANTMTVFPGGPAGTVACSQVGGGLLPQQQHRLYSTIPAVSDALRERASSGTTATLMTRQVFQPTIGRPVKLMGTLDGNGSNPLTPPSPDYQSLDQVTSQIRGGNGVWQPQQQQFFGCSTKVPRMQSSSYGCLIDTSTGIVSSVPEEQEEEGERESGSRTGHNRLLRHNYYEVNPLMTTVDDSSFSMQYQRGGGGGGGRCQRSATLGRLVKMEESSAAEGRESDAFLQQENNSRSYSHLEATNCLNEETQEQHQQQAGADRDRPGRYTYQAIREASFV